MIHLDWHQARGLPLPLKGLDSVSIWVFLTWAVFIAAIIVIVILFLHFAWSTKREVTTAKARIVEIQELFGVAKRSRIEARQRAAKASTLVREVWTEYDETLVEDRYTNQTRSTIEASFFFNSHSIATGLFENRWTQALPGALIAVGVAGTFFKLTFGLSGLDLSNDVEIDVLQASVMTLLNTAGLSFMASGIGVAMSLFATSILSRRQNEVSRSINALVSDVDGYFERYSAEFGIQKVEGNTREIAQSLNELHEKIGVEFQKSVQSLSSDMETAIIGAINVALAPAMQNLSDATSRQSGEVFESLVDRFSDAFQGMGQSQASAMKSASEGLVDSVASLSGQVGEALERMEKASVQNADSTSSSISHMLASAQTQAREDREAYALAASAAREQAQADRQSHAELLAQLQATSTDSLARFRSEASEQTDVLQRQLGELADAANGQQKALEANIEQLVQVTARTQSLMETSSKSLTASSFDLKSIAEGFTATTQAVTSKLSDAIASIQTVSQQQAQSLRSLEQHSTAINQVTSNSNMAGEKLAAAANEAKVSFQEMREHQTEFLLGLGESLDGAKTSLTDSIEQTAKKMSDWLAAYAEAVSSQTDERLEVWNKHSTQYASSMLDIAKSLEGVVDELEGVSKNRAFARKAVLS